MIQIFCEIYNLLDINMKRTLITISFFLAIWALYKTARYLYFKPAVHEGEVALPINVQLKDGSFFNLSDLKGKYVLLHFWGSWCLPCRRESPSIKALYDEFNGKKFRNADGFEILSIGIESSKSRWQSAIIGENFNWKFHTSDFLMFDSKIAKDYGIRQIPTLLLVGPNQQILGNSWTPDSVRKYLSDNIAK